MDLITLWLLQRLPCWGGQKIIEEFSEDEHNLAKAGFEKLDKEMTSGRLQLKKRKVHEVIVSGDDPKAFEDAIEKARLECEPIGDNISKRFVHKYMIRFTGDEEWRGHQVQKLPDLLTDIDVVTMDQQATDRLNDFGQANAPKELKKTFGAGKAIYKDRAVVQRAQTTIRRTSWLLRFPALGDIFKSDDGWRSGLIKNLKATSAWNIDSTAIFPAHVQGLDQSSSKSRRVVEIIRSGPYREYVQNWYDVIVQGKSRQTELCSEKLLILVSDAFLAYLLQLVLRHELVSTVAAERLDTYHSDLNTTQRQELVFRF